MRLIFPCLGPAQYLGKYRRRTTVADAPCRSWGGAESGCGSRGVCAETLLVVTREVLTLSFLFCCPPPPLLFFLGSGSPGARPCWAGGWLFQPLPGPVWVRPGGSGLLAFLPEWRLGARLWWGGSPPCGALSPPWGGPLRLPPGPLGFGVPTLVSDPTQSADGRCHCGSSVAVLHFFPKVLTNVVSCHSSS